MIRVTLHKPKYNFEFHYSYEHEYAATSIERCVIINTATKTISQNRVEAKNRAPIGLKISIVQHKSAAMPHHSVNYGCARAPNQCHRKFFQYKLLRIFNRTFRHYTERLTNQIMKSMNFIFEIVCTF